MPGCPVDLAFVVDGSGSIAIDEPYGDPKNWKDVIKFLKAVVNSFDIGPYDTQIGLVSFDEV